MKIAILSSIHWRTPPEKYGPLELIASYIADGMVKRGHEVTLYATKDSITKAKLKWVCPQPLQENINLNRRVYEYLHTAQVFEDADNYDIIHNHYDAYPVTFSKLVKTPVITTIHGYYDGIEEIYNKYPNSHFVSISFAQRKQLPKLKYIENIYHGIPIEKFPFNEKPKDYFCFLGRISPTKGVHLAVQLAKKLGFKLFLAGIVDTVDQSYFNKEIKPYLGDQIQYLGNLGDEKKDLLKNARGLLHLTTVPEAFGLTLVESMACGTPVIGTDLGSISEIIEDKKTGFVVSNCKQMEEAIKKIDQISRKNCRERVEKYFTIEKMVDKYEKVYRKILES